MEKARELVRETIELADDEDDKAAAQEDYDKAEASVASWKANPGHEEHIKILDDIEAAQNSLKGAEDEYVISILECVPVHLKKY